MKAWITIDNGDGEVTAHAKREEAEAEAIRRGGDGGTWADAPSYGYRKYSGPKQSLRVMERPVQGDPLGEFPPEKGLVTVEAPGGVVRGTNITWTA